LNQIPINAVFFQASKFGGVFNSLGFAEYETSSYLKKNSI